MNSDKYAWQFESKPEAGIDNRRLHCPRGRVLGGSSSINGMVYVRGHACDFDEWVEHGAAGWSYQECLPYFRRAESWISGEDIYRGGDGPLATCNGNNMTLNLCIRHLSMPDSKRAIREPMIITAISRKLWPYAYDG